MRFVIQGRLPSLNEYIRDCRTNKYKANTTKRDVENYIIFAIRKAKVKKVTIYPIALKIAWYEPNKKRDIDNITFATKFIQDALVKSGIIENDNQKCIVSLEHTVKVDKLDPRIEVEIERVD